MSTNIVSSIWNILQHKGDTGEITITATEKPGVYRLSTTTPPQSFSEFDFSFEPEDVKTIVSIQNLSLILERVEKLTLAKVGFNTYTIKGYNGDKLLFVAHKISFREVLIEAELMSREFEKPQRKEHMKTREEIIDQADELRNGLTAAAASRAISPSLCQKLIGDLSLFINIVKEEEAPPTNEALLQFLKDKINSNHLTEAAVVDAMISNTRQRARAQTNDGCM